MKIKTNFIGLFDAKTHLSNLIVNVQKGREYIITKRGRPVAKLVPYRNPGNNQKIEEIILHFDSIRNSVKGKVNIREYITEGRQ